MSMIKEDKWFKEGYNPVNRDDEEEDVSNEDEAFSIQEVVYFCTSIFIYIYLSFYLFMLVTQDT